MEVRTNLDASNVNRAIINSVIGQMSDGIWENSSRMENIWRGLSFEVSDDNKIIITVERPSELYYKKPEEVADYIANKIKQIIKIEIQDGLNATWDRNERAVSDYLSRWEQPVLIRDAYQAYDILKNRKIKSIVPIQIDASEITTGMDIEGYGKISFVQEIDVDGDKYLVIKAGAYSKPSLISADAKVYKRMT